jgi:hypothetical protein
MSNITAEDLWRFFFMLDRDPDFIECYAANHKEDDSAAEFFANLATELVRAEVEPIIGGRWRASFHDQSSLIFTGKRYLGMG